MRAEIANIVYPVFSAGLRLKERLDAGEEPVFDSEQSALLGLLQAGARERSPVVLSEFAGEGAEEPAGELAVPFEDSARRAERFLGIRYALACWLDEVFVLDSPWSARWNERKLEGTLFGTNDRAWKFWEQARLAATRPGSEALEAFFLCVVLGFRGEMAEQTERLRAWVAGTRTQISRGQAREWAAPPEIEPPTAVPPLRGRQRLQRMALVAGLCLLGLVPVVAFFLVRRLG
jgi:type VI secretion system protein ImpK